MKRFIADLKKKLVYERKVPTENLKLFLPTEAAPEQSLNKTSTMTTFLIIPVGDCCISLPFHL